MAREPTARCRPSSVQVLRVDQLRYLCLRVSQAGINDFILENVGKIKAAKFHPDAQRRRLYFST
eukprot:1887691-Rhodomonas_salina.1